MNINVGDIVWDSKHEAEVKVVALGDQGGALVNPETEGIMYADETYRVAVVHLGDKPESEPLWKPQGLPEEAGDVFGDNEVIDAVSVTYKKENTPNARVTVWFGVVKETSGYKPVADVSYEILEGPDDDVVQEIREDAEAFYDETYSALEDAEAERDQVAERYARTTWTEKDFFDGVNLPY